MIERSSEIWYFSSDNKEATTVLSVNPWKCTSFRISIKQDIGNYLLLRKLGHVRKACRYVKHMSSPWQL